jgi:hypothetical protein
VTWERGQLEAVFGQVARRNLGQMATRAGSWENGHVSALLQRPVSMVISVSREPDGGSSGMLLEVEVGRKI